MKIKPILLALSAALVLAGCERGAQSGDAVAHVNGEPISEQMFQFHLERRTGGQPELATPEQRRQMLDELIDMVLLAQLAESQDAEDDAVVAARMEYLRSAALAQAAIDQMATEEVPDAEIQAEYDERFGGEQPREYRARHILVKDKEKAEQLIKELDEGADFGGLAKKNSTGPTGPAGGDLGWFQPAQMVPPFAEAVQKLEPGTYTKEPVHTQFGWHVILLEKTRPIEVPTLAEVRPQLASLLAQRHFQERIDQLRQDAKIEVALPEAPQQPADEPQQQTAPEQAPADAAADEPASAEQPAEQQPQAEQPAQQAPAEQQPTTQQPAEQPEQAQPAPGN